MSVPLPNAPHRRSRRWHAAWLPCLLLAGFAATLGCDSESDVAQEVMRSRQRRATESAAVDHLAEAMRYLQQLAELDRNEAARQIAFHLNQWRSPKPSDPWSRPSLIATWPEIAGQFESVQTLDENAFQVGDIQHLELSYLASRVNNWSMEGEPIDTLHSEWLAEKQASLPTEAGRQLERAIRLFDWTIRNVRLEPLQLIDDAQQTPPLPLDLQFMGPGYRQTTLQTLWRGSGDAFSRSRVFLELCRQAGIDACMLSPADDASMLWAIGTRIGDAVYLFEPNLGIAIPGPDQTGVATLQEARSDPSVLRRLRVPGWFEYPLTPDQIESCKALIDASPEMLSQRMHVLEESLTGTNRMKLTLDVDALAQRLTGIDGIETAELWSMVLMAAVYDETLTRLRRDDPLLDRYYALTFGMLTGESPVALGRWKHLTGQFTGDEDTEGARQIYMGARMPDADIEALPYDVELQKRQGVRRLPNDTAEQFAFRIATVQQLLRNAKESATYWLALLQMDDGRFETASNWLRKRILDANEAGPWHEYARYNLGRCYEQLDQLEEAIELYKTQNVPQEQGNRIRARFLSRQLDQPTDEETES